MQIKIKVMDVQIENKGKYFQATVDYKDLGQGKPSTKKLMSFTFKDVYAVISKAKTGDEFTVELQKNDKGYWDWVSVGEGGSSPATAKSSSGTSAPATAAPRSNFETPEERATRQIYIIRQSSISSAVEHLNHVKKSYDPLDILSLAKVFEDYVFGRNVEADSPNSLPNFDEDEDVPM